jgi:hypothetical protein
VGYLIFRELDNHTSFAPLGHPEDTNMVPYLQVEDTKASEN